MEGLDLGVLGGRDGDGVSCLWVLGAKSLRVITLCRTGNFKGYYYTF